MYIQIMIQSLNQKKEVLEKLIDYTREQDYVLREEEVDLDQFGQIIDEKEAWIEKLNLLDTGFEKIFDRVKEEIQLHRDQYQAEIVNMQNLIKEITDLSVVLKTSEIRNKTNFDLFSHNKKNEIKTFKLNNSSVQKYNQNMLNQYQGESYFLDKKK